MPALKNALRPLRVEVITHESNPPSPWAGYKLCLEDIPRACTHLAILQDDTVPSPRFAKAVRQIAKTHPDVPVCLFLGGLPRDAALEAGRALTAGRRYSTLSLQSFMPIVAVLWPRHKAEEFLEWTKDNATLPGVRGEIRSDDAVAGRWKRITKQTVLTCVPSIVEHPDEVVSTIGKRSPRSKWPARKASFIAEDAGAYDWSQP